jgi:hypothetical protein
MNLPVIGKDEGVKDTNKKRRAKHRQDLERGKPGSVYFPDTGRQIHLSAGQ